MKFGNMKREQRQKKKGISLRDHVLQKSILAETAERARKPWSLSCPQSESTSARGPPSLRRLFVFFKLTDHVSHALLNLREFLESPHFQI